MDATEKRLWEEFARERMYLYETYERPRTKWEVVCSVLAVAGWIICLFGSATIAIIAAIAVSSASH